MLLSWFTKYKSSNFSKNTFPKLNPKDIKNFPIPKEISNSQDLVNLVKLLLNIHEEYMAITNSYIKFLQAKFSLEILSNKIQNWEKLDFSDFIKELNKAIKKVGGEKLSKLDEMEWMEVFKSKKAEAQTLKTQIDKTDREIDAMVYELYGLSEEEIAIVKGE